MNTDEGYTLNTSDSISQILDDYEKSVYTTQSLQNFSQNYNPQTYTLIDGNLDGHPTIMCNHDFVKLHISEFYNDEMYPIALKWENEIKLDVLNTKFSIQKIKSSLF